MIKPRQGTQWWIRICIPIALVVIWITVAGIGGPYFGRVSEVSSNDLSTFLPKNAESTKVRKELEKFQTSDTLPLIAVFESDSELTSQQIDQISATKNAIQASGVVKGDVSPAVISEDKKAAFTVIPLNSDSDFKKEITTLRTAVSGTATSLKHSFTGPVMFSSDLSKAFSGIDGTLLLVALSVVFVILLVVYRSPILPIVTLAGASMALAVSILVVWHLANAGIVQLNGQVQGILFILVIGAATDYALLYIARYREELIRHTSALEATKAAWRASWEPILAAGGTVTLGLICLLVSDLGSNKALGPVGGIGIIFAMLSALTFLPAALLLFGRTAFWPKLPDNSPHEAVGSYKKEHPTWARVGKLVSRHPRRLWVGILVILLIACIFVPQLKADGVAQSELIIGKSEARDGQAVLDRHFPSGSGSPTYILVPQDNVDTIVSVIEADGGVDTVSIITTDPLKSTAPIGRSESKLKYQISETVRKTRDEQLIKLDETIRAQMVGLPEQYIAAAYNQAANNVPSIDDLVAQAYPFTGLQPKVVDGFVVVQATLKDVASSVAARDTVARLRNSIHKTSPEVLLGGVSAIQLDTNTASEHDLRLIIPLILCAITIVLMLLLRSIVAPLVLLLTTVLSFGATLGIAALLFNHVWNFAGADPAVVIFGFVFLVALGIDYNIFLMTRVREETLKHGVRDGTLKALVVTGGVITSAGIVLASTFAALNVIPILFLAEISFIVAFGVLLDTLIVRSLLVPSLTLEIGKVMWWPSKLWKKAK